MKRTYPFLATVILIACGYFPSVQAQQVALKTNLLYLGTTTPNLELEIALGKKTTLELLGSYNPFRFGNKDSNKKIQHWAVMPEIRMWTYEKFEGHFFGVHGLFVSYNAGNIDLPLDVFPGLKDSRYEGHGVGGGLSYGYQWYISPHWNMEAQFGFGYVYLDYKRYECYRCGEFIEKKHKHYFGPTKIGVSLIYLFTSK